MKEVNLLPLELLKKTGTRKVASDVQNVVVLGFVLFFLAVAASVAYIVILGFQIRNLNQRQINLENSVKALEKTEQEVVLVKDRVEKTKKVLETDGAYGEIVNFDEIILNYIPLTAKINQVELSDEDIKVSYTVASSSDLIGLFRNILDPEIFSVIELESLSFSPESGYLVSLRIEDI